MPTYNECDNITTTIGGVFRNTPQVDVLVVDDASPDGTGDIADGMAARDRRVHVIHRSGKQGLGPAYLAGFDWALERGYALICEMDMDGSHRPEDLAKLLQTVRHDAHVDLVIGSRRISGGATEGWSPWRNGISQAGSWYARVMLGLSVRDMTAGFRVYRADILRKMALESVADNGYVFQIDMTRRVARMGGHIVEVPIVFPDRVHGESKMDSSIVVEAMRRVTGWGFERAFNYLRACFARIQR